MATKKKPLMDDHDDAHFSDNPALRKHHAKKRVGSTGKGRSAVKFTHKPIRKVTRKRVAGK
jgi:hypothetical protein